MPQVIEIKATKQDVLKIKVAAYARVSSDSADQQNSFSTQVKHYSKLINDNKDWQFVDMYADMGITGTRDDIRPEFKRLLNDCRNGEIDKVIVKSISRFARDTKTCLEVIRELSSLGVSVIFESQNIDTGNMAGEMYLAINAAIAQEESISISKNLQMGIQSRMKRGEYITNSLPYGYRYDNSNLIIHKEEASIVQIIFQLYLSGSGIKEIHSFLIHNNKYFCQKPLKIRTIQYILQNEKYIGDTLLQKKYTQQALPFKRVINKGEIKQYYIKNSHVGIINAQTYLKVQDIIKSKQRTIALKSAHQDNSIATSKIECVFCNSKFRKKLRDNNAIVYVCKCHDIDKQNCPVMPVQETDIHRAFLYLFNKLLKNKDAIIKPMLKTLEKAMQKSLATNETCAELNKSIADLLDKSHALTKLHSNKLIDTATFFERNNDVESKLTKLRTELARKRKPNNLNLAYKETKNLLAILNESEPLHSFDKELFSEVVKKLSIDNEQIYFELFNGLTLSERIKDYE